MEPSRLGKEKKEAQKKRPSHREKKQKKLKITETVTIKNEAPEGAIFKGYSSFIIQEMVTQVKNIEYRCARWLLSDGTYYTEEIPVAYKGSHFGPELRKHILYQHHNNRVTQGKIHQELKDKGIIISVGQIDAILQQETKNFAQEKEDILPAAMQVSTFLQTDDTGSRHNGKNGFSTVICNEMFSYFKTTDSKSRITFLKNLNVYKRPFIINDDALVYAKEHGLGQATFAWFASKLGEFYDEGDFVIFLQQRILSNKDKRIITEACLFAACIDGGFSREKIILSDGARQFNLFNHALCWIHAERALKKIIPVDDEEKKAVEYACDLVWNFYDELKEYKKSPSMPQKNYLENRFDEIFSMPMHGFSIAPIFANFRRHKHELLVVLDHPEIPLHNNNSERDIREHVIKRKISGSTRSLSGRDARDIFNSLIKTCLKNQISFWNFLDDRIKKTNLIPPLAQVIIQRAAYSDP